MYFPNLKDQPSLHKMHVMYVYWYYASQTHQILYLLDLAVLSHFFSPKCLYFCYTLPSIDKCDLHICLVITFYYYRNVTICYFVHTNMKSYYRMLRVAFY